MNAKPRKLTDLPLDVLHTGLREVVESIGPNCGTARAYRQAIADMERSQRTPQRETLSEEGAPDGQ